MPKKHVRVTVTVDGIDVSGKQNYGRIVPYKELKAALKNKYPYLESFELKDSGGRIKLPGKDPLPAGHYFATITTATREFLEELQLPESQELLTPFDGIGRILLNREHLVDRFAGSIVAQTRFPVQHYWRAPRGSGKTTFLFLLGEKLKTLGCTVYYLNDGKKLTQDYVDSIKNEVIRQLQINANKKIVLIVDEADGDHGHWVSLLKPTDRLFGKLIVLGAGVPQFQNMSANFATKHNAEELLFKHSEMDSLVDALHNVMRVDKDKNEALKRLCKYVQDQTGGHLFVMLKLCEYVVDQDKWYEDELYQKILTRSALLETEVYKEIISRCYSDDAKETAAFLRVYSGSPQSTDKSDLEKIGVFNSTRNVFLSSFYETVQLNRSFAHYHVKDVDIVKIPDNATADQKLELIIKTGLSKMTDNDFQDPYCDDVADEDAIGHRFGVYVSQHIAGLYIAAQVPPEGRSRAAVDYVFNGSVDVALELTRNASDRIDVEHAGRFTGEGGFPSAYRYEQWKDRFAVLNFQVSIDNVPSSVDNNSYTFVLKENTLYCGGRAISVGIAKVATKPMPSRKVANRLPSTGTPVAVTKKRSLLTHSEVPLNKHIRFEDEL